MLNSDFRDILSAFCEERVEFMLVGAYAVAAHGLPRATGVLISGSERQQKTPIACGRLFLSSAPRSQICRNKTSLGWTQLCNLEVTPRRIDILTGITGVDFESAERATVIIEIEGVKVPVISLSHLIQNKIAVGRPQDVADVARLEQWRS